MYVEEMGWIILAFYPVQCKDAAQLFSCITIASIQNCKIFEESHTQKIECFEFECSFVVNVLYFLFIYCTLYTSSAVSLCAMLPISRG